MWYFDRDFGDRLFVWQGTSSRRSANRDPRDSGSFGQAEEEGMDFFLRAEANDELEIASKAAEMLGVVYW